MKKYNYILVLFVVLLTACEDYLEKTDTASEFFTEEEVFQDRAKITGIVARLYDTMEWTFEIRTEKSIGNVRHNDESGKNYGNINIASGEGVSTWARGPIDKLAVGDYFGLVAIRAQNPDFDMCWWNMWEAIYVSNILISLIDDIPLTVFSPNVELATKERDQIKGEAYLFRGLAYHEISKRWGPMPYLKERILPDTDLNLVRPTNLEQINDIVADLDVAIATLPEVAYMHDIPEDVANAGRYGKAAAMAIKSRALTIAASPNYAGFDPNTSGVDHSGNDPELWRRAAIAASDVIKLSETSSKVGLLPGDEYGEIFHTNATNIEAIFPRYYPIGTPANYRLSWFAKSQSGHYGIAPSQEMVELFETERGFKTSDPSSGYNLQDAYGSEASPKRDPRFYKDIIYHDGPFVRFDVGDRADFRTTPLGLDRDPLESGTLNSKTGYLVKKFIPPGWTPNRGFFSDATYINAPYIRLAEMYLNYAEAVNELDGPNGTAEGSTLTSLEAINTIRRRVGHVDVRPEYHTNKEEFRKIIRNEFRVELCFEYHVWFDLIRWRIAEEEIHQHNYHGLLIEASTDLANYPTGWKYAVGEVPYPRVFEKRHYRYPIPQRDLEVFQLPNLKQNPGW